MAVFRYPCDGSEVDNYIFKILFGIMLLIRSALALACNLFIYSQKKSMHCLHGVYGIEC